ncbi:MAG TPA: VOC family protein [Anaerolineae bacterium]|nr:VOC family protein [Anaerolineae bacterium]
MTYQQPIDPRTHVGVVSLTVANLARSMRFYGAVLGLTPAERGNGSVLLAAGDTPLLHLVELPGAQPKPARATGLYHFAVLLPSRPELARWLRHMLDGGWPLQGWSDHGVSEAIYLADPDDNGIEIYRDRPRSEWPVLDGALQMTTDPLDARGLLALAGDAAPSGYAMPTGAVMGHVHLHVADIPQAQAFYCDVLGFDLVQRYGPSALFVSAGGYHHHIGLNTWAGVGAPPAPAGSAGLRYFTVVVPDEASLTSLVGRVQGAGIAVVPQDGGWQLQDPSGSGIRLVVRDAR